MGCSDDNEIATRIALHFSDLHTQAGLKSFTNQSPSFQSRPINSNQSISNLFTVELIGSSITKLSLGKAYSPDDLPAEHLLNAHPSITITLADLFKQLVTHRYVPIPFGVGPNIPLVKDKSQMSPLG
jgi:hypothetical protein